MRIGNFHKTKEGDYRVTAGHLAINGHCWTMRRREGALYVIHAADEDDKDDVEWIWEPSEPELMKMVNDMTVISAISFCHREILSQQAVTIEWRAADA